MTQKYSQEQAFALLKVFEVSEKKRKSAEAEEVISALKSGIVPTPEPIARILVWSGASRHSLMRHHSYWKVHRLRQGFDALINSALVAHIDLSKCDAALTAYASSRDRFEEHVGHTVESPAQKEVMAFCASLFGTVDTLRRIKTALPKLSPEIDKIRKSLTDGSEFKFLLDLRKNLSHGSVTVPNWSTSTDEFGTKGNMKFDVGELLAFGNWREESKAFIESFKEGYFAISEVTAICTKQLLKLRHELNELFHRERTPEEEDFYRIEDLSSKISNRQFIKMILQSHVQKGTDPYPFLPRFFEPKILREILKKPPHSVEQVEYIIAVRAHEIDCDAHLRAMLYKLFGVTDNIPDGLDPPSLNPPPLQKLWP